MLRFKFQQFVLGGRYYVPLPKLTRQQTDVVASRLVSVGFRLSRAMPLKAAKGDMTVTVLASGLCWSNRDITDLLAPVIPKILSSEKEVVPLAVIQDSYLRIQRQGEGALLRLSPRIESSSLWEQLRASDSCALTPDEKEVYATILATTKTEASLLTDFPTHGSRVARIGQRQYYETRLDAAEAASTLRGTESKGQRNAYLPRDSMLRFERGPSPAAMRGLFEDLGEWSYLSPA